VERPCHPISENASKRIRRSTGRKGYDNGDWPRGVSLSHSGYDACDKKASAIERIFLMSRLQCAQRAATRRLNLPLLS
jgi:hypothetical protein